MLRLLLIASTLLSLSASSQDKTPPRKREPKAPATLRGARVRPVNTPKEAEAIAERETGGEAVSSRRIPLNGATGGWEVDVRMPKGDRGYRCIIDNDTHAVHSKSLIPNPPRTGRRR